MRPFGQLEAMVMDRLWDVSTPLSVREVLEGLPDERDRAYTTVMTVLDNLFRKGYVTREREGRAYRYRPAASREAHTAAMMEQVLGSGGDRGATLLHFVGQISDEEVAELRKALAEFEGDTR